MTFQKYLEATERLAEHLSRQGGDEAAPTACAGSNPPMTHSDPRGEFGKGQGAVSEKLGRPGRAWVKMEEVP
jgi:hypothetical protein